MFERLTAARPLPVQLHCDSGHRILAPQGTAILGWFGGASAGAAQPLTIPPRLLAPKPTTGIAYACNLPAAVRNGGAVLEFSGELPNEIGRKSEAHFLAESLPGGTVGATAPDGERVTVQLRWICLTAHASIGAVWRCFVRCGAPAAGCWRAIEHDYIFDAGGGAVMNPPASALSLPCGAAFTEPLLMTHPEGMLTSFPCNLGRVKVTRLSADGWPKRHLMRLVMQDDNRIVAFFSDGRQEMVATAAPSSRRALRAAA